MICPLFCYILQISDSFFNFFFKYFDFFFFNSAGSVYTLYKFNKLYLFIHVMQKNAG